MRDRSMCLLGMLGLCGVVVTVLTCNTSASPKPVRKTASKDTSADTDVKKEEKPKPIRIVPNTWPGIPADFSFPEGIMLGGVIPETFAIGASRPAMSDQELRDREYAMVMAQVVIVLGKEEMVLGAERMQEYLPLIEKTAKKYGIDGELFAGLLWLESQGRATAKAGTSSAAGIAQFTMPTARALGLKVQCTVTRSGGKGKKKKVSKQCTDERLDPEKAIPVAAKFLKAMMDRYGQEDFAVAAYHMGEPQLDVLLITYLGAKYVAADGMQKNITDAGIRFADVFFRNTPYVNANTFKKIVALMKLDRSPTYYFRVRCATELLKLYRMNKDGFEILAKAQRRYDGKEVSYRFWSWYAPEDLKKFADLTALKKAYEDGELVAIDDNPHLLGFDINRTGENAIAEYDMENQDLYIGLDQQTATVLLDFGQEWQKLRGEKKGFTPRITSLTRTEAYQEKLKRMGFPTTSRLPMHTVGRAFDIWKFADDKKPLTRGQERDITFLLDELEWTGQASYTTQEPGCWHVVPPPQ